MKRLLIYLFLSLTVVCADGQQARRRTMTQHRTAAAKKKTVARKPRAQAKTKTARPTVKGLENERKQVQARIKAEEQRLYHNRQGVKKGLENLMILNTEIEGKRKTIDAIRTDITSLDSNIVKLNRELELLQTQLEDRKQKFIKSMRYLHHNRSIKNQLMFIFSAKNFTQMYRRMRFMREYATYQRAQGEVIKEKKEQISQKKDELQHDKDLKNGLLSKGEQEKRELEGKQSEQKRMVSNLQRQQKTIETIIAKQKQRDAQLNAQIDRLIAEEIARQKARAEAEAKRKAEAEAARKRAAAEEAKRRAEQKRAAAKNEKERKEAEQEIVRAEREKKEASTQVFIVSSDDRRISGSFEQNRGRLPMPITGPYRIVSHFGQYDVEGLRNVRLDNKGINIQGQPGAKARSIFDGEVSAVFRFSGTVVVMVRHGNYISVYCNLSSVNVHKGQRVNTRTILGTVGADNILQFQLRRETAKLNPESWLSR